MSEVKLHPRVIELFQTCEAAIEEGAFTVPEIVQRLLLLAAGYAITPADEPTDHNADTVVCGKCFVGTAQQAYAHARTPVISCPKCGQHNRLAKGIRDVLTAVCGKCKTPLISLMENAEKEDRRAN